ncbi:SAM-dependent DNA methyltransferase [Enorma phocaeensis]|uniref:SAM-dependent DNA methyltransferase n=1 Tax=Enorma phocaeensis TaxID=1871019 RepID=UPI0023557F3B|nr:SAM-dependent DNA methyltransferase [Enorma phocaeensis]
MSAQVKSRARVQDHGEVFTNEREVNAMLDMVKQETERIDSRFLEPACGDGNFLAEVLRRKLDVVRTRYRRSLFEYEKYTFVAVGSIYGVDILSDNTQECRERLFDIVENDYLSVCKKSPTPGFLDAIRFVIGKNILCGNALSLKTVDSSGADTDEPIIFCEWSLVGDKVKRLDYRFDEMLEGSASQTQFSLFGLSGTPTSEWELDEETGAMIPKPIREYPLVSLCEVGRHE